MTWVLLLFIGLGDPIQVEGYRIYDDCKAAGRDAIKRLPLCNNGSRKCYVECIMGP